jgi:hypothetical protein
MALNLRTEAGRAKRSPSRLNAREAKIAEAVVAEMDSKIGVVAALQHTTVGGAAAEDITIAGVLATDVVSVVLHTVGSTPRTVSKAVAASGKVTVTFSDDPADDHVVNVIVVRPV